MRMLLTGAGGLLGSDVALAAARAGHELEALPRERLDIREEPAVLAWMARTRPEAVINCAAFTDVDGAESMREQAFELNAHAAGSLARAAGACGARMLHISSDYVFDGRAPLDADGRPRGYLESDATGPRSVYGQSKLAGERLVLAAGGDHLIVRSSWLFGTGGRNFAATMLALAAGAAEQERRAAVSVVTDQVGCPTWTGHLAPALIGLLERGVTGIVHQAGGGATSWNGFAREIFRQAEVECEVLEASSAQMARPAPRPAWSVLESEREDVLPLPPWQDGLGGYLAARAGVVRT